MRYYDQESIKKAFFSLNSDAESQRRFLDDIYETLIEYIDVSFSRFWVADEKQNIFFVSLWVSGRPVVQKKRKNKYRIIYPGETDWRFKDMKVVHNAEAYIYRLTRSGSLF